MPPELVERAKRIDPTRTVAGLVGSTATQRSYQHWPSQASEFVCVQVAPPLVD